MLRRDEVAAWFRGRVPDNWFTGPVDVDLDRDEIVVTGTLPEPSVAGLADEQVLVALAARVSGFREDTRDHRIQIASEAERRFERKVSWRVRCGGCDELFTHANVPVMTRLRMPERQVLDTLIDASVARTRSEALAWCVRLVGQHQDDWIADLRHAMQHVEEVRTRGPR